MSDVKINTIFPISVYCFALGAYFLILAVHAVFGHKEGLAGADIISWILAVLFTVLAVGFIALGGGILNFKRWCWKTLFSILAIALSSMASFTMVFVIFLMIHVKLIVPFFKLIQLSNWEWISFFIIFLSGMIVLYYLVSDEVVACFGDMGPLVSPF